MPQACDAGFGGWASGGLHDMGMVMIEKTLFKARVCTFLFISSKHISKNDKTSEICGRT